MNIPVEGEFYRDWKYPNNFTLMRITKVNETTESRRDDGRPYLIFIYYRYKVGSKGCNRKAWKTFDQNFRNRFHKHVITQLLDK